MGGGGWSCGGRRWLELWWEKVVGVVVGGGGWGCGGRRWLGLWWEAVVTGSWW